jgi:hypothetical protein
VTAKAQAGVCILAHPPSPFLFLFLFLFLFPLPLPFHFHFHFHFHFQFYFHFQFQFYFQFHFPLRGRQPGAQLLGSQTSQSSKAQPSHGNARAEFAARAGRPAPLVQ